MIPWMAWLIMIPLVAALIAFLSGRRTLPWLPLLVITAIFVVLSGLTGQLWEYGPQRHTIGGWGAPLGIDLYVDGLSLLMLWLTGGIGALVSLYALGYFLQEPRKTTLFWPLWLLLWTALNALFLAADLFNLYVTLELLTLSAVVLVALAGDTTALRASMRYLLFAFLGSFSYLLGVILLYGRFGTLDITLLTQAVTPEPAAWLAIAFMTAGLLTKTAIFPLHVWLPPAHSSAPAPVSALLSALVVKASFYLLLRLWLTVFSPALIPLAGQLLGILGAGAILYGSLQALRQSRLKMLVAYSTVAQLGYLLLLFPLANLLAWKGAVYYALSHGLAKAALFLAAGNILHVLGHDRIKDLHELNRGPMLTLFTFGIAGMSIIGMPPSGGFLAKWLLLKAALESGQWWWAVVIQIGGLLAAGYIFQVLRYAFVDSKIPATSKPVFHLPWTMSMAPLVLALLALGLGFAGTPILNLLNIGSLFSLAETLP